MTYDRRRAALLFAALLVVLLSIALGGLLALELAPWPVQQGAASNNRL